MKKSLFLGLYFLSPLMMIRILYEINPNKYSDLKLFIAMSLGVAAYNWFIWQFILGARPKFIDKIIGLDKIYRLHGIMAIVSIIFALTHNLILDNFYIETKNIIFGEVALWLYIGISVLSILKLTRSKWGKFKFILSINKYFEWVKKIKYEHHKLLHNLSVVGLVLMQIHVLMTSNAKRYEIIYRMYMVYFILAVLFYLYHKVLRPWIVKENEWTIEQVNHLSEDVCEIKMTSKNHNLKYKPGQFGFFKMKVGKKYEQHPFSFTSSFSKNKTISIAIKSLGDFTSNVNQLKKGDKIYLDGPYGEFTYLNYSSEKETFFIAGGVGITPVMSMINHMSIHEPNRNVVLLWGIKTSEDFIFKSEFEILMKKMPNLKMIPVMSNEDNYIGETGYIDYDKLIKYINTKSSDVGYYICGPSILMKSAKNNLNDLNIPLSKIHYESFTM